MPLIKARTKSVLGTHRKVCDWDTGVQLNQQLRSRTSAMGYSFNPGKCAGQATPAVIKPTGRFHEVHASYNSCFSSAYATLDSSCNPSFHISVTANGPLIVITAIGHSPKQP
ncbi:hypothetical protein RU639_001393 [Aspergillus parasiticus]